MLQKNQVPSHTFSPETFHKLHPKLQDALKFPNLSGFLFKKTNLDTTWRKGWFQVKDGKIHHHHHGKTNSTPIESLILSPESQIRVPGVAKMNGDGYLFEIWTPNETWCLMSKDEGTRNEWLNGIKVYLRYTLKILRSSPKPQSLPKVESKKTPVNQLFEKQYLLEFILQKVTDARTLCTIACVNTLASQLCRRDEYWKQVFEATFGPYSAPSHKGATVRDTYRSMLTFTSSKPKKKSSFLQTLLNGSS